LYSPCLFPVARLRREVDAEPAGLPSQPAGKFFSVHLCVLRASALIAGRRLLADHLNQ
jgi:hypothetical protein